jgi:hypothetical protein
MRNLLLSIAIVMIWSGCKKDAETTTSYWNRELIPVNDTLYGTITTNTLLTSGHSWYIRGWVYVTNEATLRIEPGAKISLLSAKKSGGIVVTRGAKMVAAGTPVFPIDFSFHHAAPGSGIILLGKAPQLNILTELEDPAGAGTLSYGGDLANDSSGTLQHIRLSYNRAATGFKGGLILLGTGNKTLLKDIMLSHPDTFNRANTLH